MMRHIEKLPEHHSGEPAERAPGSGGRKQVHAHRETLTSAHAPLTIGDLQPGHHLCCLYETEEEHRAVLTPFVRQGLERGEKVLYIVDARQGEAILPYLGDSGVDVESYIASGQLTIRTADDVYMQQGVFDPDEMIGLLRAETEQALTEGYAALRITGETSWALRGLPGSERLMEYEAKLNEFFPGTACLAICQYDRRAFSPSVLLDVLRSHPVAVVGTSVHDNFYYIPPAELLGHEPLGAQLRHSVENLVERRRAEEGAAAGGNGEGNAPTLRKESAVHRVKAQGLTARTADQSPIRLIMIIAVSVAVSEAFVMAGLLLLSPFPMWAAVLLDSAALVLLLLPTLYLFLLRPFALQLAERRRAEEALRQRTHDLAERVKELNCLYRLSNLVKKPDVSLEEVLQGATGLISSGWQYPGVTCARIIVEDQDFRTENFRETAWRQTSDIIVSGQRIGSVEVCYLEERPECDEGPFLKEERDLINTIAERLGQVVEQQRAEEALRKAREELEIRVERRMQAGDPYGLTFRELTVLHLVADGRADKQIGVELDISALTVNKHVAHILSKMGAASRTEAGVRAIREGLLG